MCKHLQLLAAVIFVGIFSSANVAGAQDDSAPAGIVPTQATLDQVLAAHDKVLATNDRTTSIEDGTLVEYGMKATYHEISAHEDYKITRTFSSFYTQDGAHDGQAWSRNENGIVTLEHGTHPENEIANAAVSSHTKNNTGLTLLGESSSPAAYVVEVHTPGGRHEWRYYDKATYRLVKLVAVYPNRRVTTTYDNFRTVDGITEPWHIHLSDGHPQNDVEITTTSIRYNVPVASSDLEIPGSNDQFEKFPAGAQSVSLPVKFLNDHIVVTVTIGDKGYDFFLDSGAGEILIDARVAKSLGLTMFGQSVQTDAGTYEASNAIVPDMRVGSIDMKNVVVGTSAFTSQQTSGIEVVGLLGYDFIANAGLKIDYQRGTVDALPPYLFVPPSDGVALAAAWDDGSPLIPVQLGNTAAHFILDTGAFSAVIFQRFAQDHPDAVKDEGAGTQMTEQDPFMEASGVGGSLSIKPVQIKSFMVGTINYQDFLMYEITDKQGFNYEDQDGVLGGEFLKYFTVYLDAKDNYVYLVRNGTH